MSQLHEEPLHRAVRRVIRDAASKAIMPKFRNPHLNEALEKSPGEIVTRADRESEFILVEGLSRILPEASPVGEEMVAADPQAQDRLSTGLCWLIDPLDGTANFANGRAPFGIMVALTDRGTPIGGWIHNPLTGRFCCALANEGTFVDGERSYARSSGRDRPVVGLSRLFTDPDRRDRIRSRLGESFELTAIPRCAAEQYPRTWLGRTDVTVYERTLPWDHAAGVICLAEAGGKAARLDGTSYRADQKQNGLIAAANSAQWDLASRLLSEFA